MDILLVNLANSGSKSFGVMPPTSLAVLGNVLERNGFLVRVIDLEIKPEDFDFESYLRDLNPRIVGVGGTSHSRFESFRIARIVKKVSENIFTIYGGCHASFTAEDTLSNIREIDYIVRGEGEDVLSQLVKHLLCGEGDIKSIRGVSLREGASVVHNPPQERIKDLDALSYSYHLLELNSYKVMLDGAQLPAATIMTSRGCPFKCSFCSASAMFGKSYFMRSAESVMRELDVYVASCGIKAVRFFDSTITLNRAHINSLIEQLKRREDKLLWHCEIRADSVDRELLKRMKEAGCYSVDFGMESASERVLEFIGKKNIAAAAVRVLKWCDELGIRVAVFFSFGHVAETWRDSKKTISFIAKYSKYMIPVPIFGIRIYPGTYVEQYAREHGLLPVDFSWSAPFVNTKEGPIVTDNVPYLLQPQYGIQELTRAYYEVEKVAAEQLLHIGAIMRKFNEINSFATLMHKTGTMFKLIKKSISGR